MLTALALFASLTCPAQTQGRKPNPQPAFRRTPQVNTQKPIIQYGPSNLLKGVSGNSARPATEPGRFPLQQPLPSVTPKSPAGPQSPNQKITRFDYRSAQVRWANNRWQVYAGNVLLKDFGREQRDARDASRLIHELRLTERGSIGSPAPIMEYWLADGQAPKVSTNRRRLKRIDQNSLRVQKIAGHWCVRDDKQIFFNFGVQKNAADAADEVMQRHQFSQIGYIGYPQPVMMYFVGGSGGIRPQTLRSPGIQFKPIPRDKKTGKQKPIQQTGAKPDQRAFKKEMLLQYQAQQLARGTRQLSAPITGNTSRWRFNPQRMALRQDQNRWKVVAGNLVLADFGTDYGGARQSMQLLSQSGCNELCTIGQPGPSYSYFLANGQAPRGVRNAPKGTKLQPNRVVAQQLGQHWCVCEGKQPLLSFGASRENAQEMANVIRRYRIDYLSRMSDGLVFLSRTR